MTAGELIRQVRIRQGLSQSQLARRAGTSQPVISAYERGRRDPSIETLRRLVEASGERLVLGAARAANGLPPARSAAEHGERLLDVLSLADAIPRRAPAAVLAAPRLVS